MIKKILAGLLTLTMLQIPAMAETFDVNDDNNLIEILTELDILAANFEESYKAREAITYGKYLGAVAGMMSDVVPADVLSFAENYGLVKPDEKIQLTKAISYEEAIKIMVRAGGYSEKIPGNEAAAAYWKVAGDRKLTDGIGLSKTEILTGSDMLTLLYNAIDADITDYEYDGTYYKIVEKDDETILSRYRDICELEGVVSDNGITSLTGESEVNEKSVVIGDEVMEKNNNYTVDYLGYNVRVFYKDDSGSFLFKYAIPEENYTVDLLSDDISEVNSGITLIKYDTEDDAGKVKVDPAVKVIYNGAAYYDYTVEDFVKPNTNLKFIDNNDDTVADVVIMNSYETVYVSYVTSYDSIIINRYTYEGAPNNIELDPESDEYLVSYWVGGEKVINPTIAGRSVLSIAKSKTEDPIYNIYISTETIMGTLDRINGDGKYVLDGDEFETLPEFELAKVANDNDIPEIEIGKDYIFYLDINGKVAAMASAEEGKLGYSLMLKLSQDEVDDENVQIKYMDSAGEWHVERLAEKVKLYNEEVVGKRVKASKVYNSYADADGKIVPQIVQLSKDIDGNVNVLKTAVETNQYDRDRLTKWPNAINGCFRWTTQMFSHQTGPKMFIANDYVLFSFPAQNDDGSYSMDEDDYAVGNTFKTDYTYTVTPYNMDRFMTTDCLVETGSASGKALDELFLVSRVAEGIDSDGMVKKMIFGRYGNYDEISFVAKDDSVFNGVSKGDVLGIYVDGQGRVTQKTVYYAVSQGYTPKMNVDYGGSAAGRVVDIDPETKSIRFNCGDLGDFVLRHAGRAASAPKINVYLNDAENKKIEMVDFSEILVGDFVVMTVEVAELENVIIIRNY